MHFYGKISAMYYSCPVDGKKLQTEQDAVDLIAESAWAELTVIPIERLHEDFFVLRTGAAGAFLQKFVNYDRRVAILGDISRRVEESAALRDFVVEANRGEHIWFVDTLEDLNQRLAQSPVHPRD